MKKQSIFIKLLLLFLLFTLIVNGIFWLLQSQLLSHYYIYQKVQGMEAYGTKIDRQIQEDGTSEEMVIYIRNVVEEINGRVLIIDEQDQIIYQEGLIRIGRANFIPSEHLNQARRGQTQYYKISGHSSQIELLAVLVPIDNKIYFFQTPLQPIEEAVAISQQFTLYLLLVALIVAVILSWFFSKTITKPLVGLNEVAKEMSQLNFQVRWNGNRGDEIGQLGETLNFLTEKLKTTIEALQKELQNEKNLEKMRKEFVARVSHELQTPISLIKGYTEALEDGMATNEKEREEYFTIIEDEINKMSNLVRDLLDLGQLESGNFKVNVEQLDIGVMVQRSLWKFELFKKEKNLRFQVDTSMESCEVLGDEYRIEQVLTNLLQNAVNHTESGGLISVSIQEEKENIKISVYNEGNPISEEERMSIWESFYKGSEEKKGTGLGLAIVKNVLELHGSQYGVENHEEGIMFFFTLKKVSYSCH
ncbi:integral membrane sensor signal transduction histidine kinase [Alkaliphilus metalliredigens QYMF]|uniref:histidine kinase n=1 Tax=Alkaliphilus metalliredigens (strain QYMF) TaxID=293826 RepID=A6TT28_ALKMQ|nr:HAMP domain-containing sensor histidine kinase [Alkaliphilus metalliredigens]ABR49346.1 integral membrane sensor signal transduction histidine kinase [Alkaliphilus metalliredigens QYMF]